MKVFELSKELDVTNKDVISFLKDNGYKISSHMQNVDNEMVKLVREELLDSLNTKEVDVDEDEEFIPEKTVEIENYTPKKFSSDDIIPCRSAVPWKTVTVGVDKVTQYTWGGFGDVEYITYKDLQYLRRGSLIKDGSIIIDDPDLCYQWRRELGDTYKHFIGVEYLEEFFDYDDVKFKKFLRKVPDSIKEVIKYTAINMIHNENYPSVQKLTIIDEVLGTCIKEFL